MQRIQPLFSPCTADIFGKLRKVVWAGVFLGSLAGCAGTGAPLQPEAAPGSAAETERHRLAHTRLQLGALHFGEGRYDIALSEVAQSLQAHPQYVDAYNLQGWIYLSQRDYLKADASFDRALSIRPGDSDTRYNQGWSQCQQKKFDMAHLHFDAALANPRFADAGRARTLLAKGVCWRDEGKTEQVLQVLTQAYELDPGNPSISLEYAQALWDAEDYTRARFYVRRLNNSNAASAASLWLGMRVERKLGDAVAMRQLADQLVKRFPASAEREKFEQGAFDD